MKPKKIFQKRVPTLKRQIITAFAYILIIMAATGLYLYYNQSLFFDKYNHLLENILIMNRLNEIVRNNQDILAKFRTTASRNYIPRLNANKERMSVVIGTFKGQVNNQAILQLVTEIKRLTAEYTNIINELIFAGKEQSVKLAAQAEEFINPVAINVNIIYQYQIDEIRAEYKQYTNRKQNTEIIALIILVAVIGLNLILIFIFINNILRPIKVLTAAAGEVSNGNFGVSEVKPSNASEEVIILTEAFNRMIGNIKHFIRELNRKIDIERQLKEEEIKIERVKVSLREAELMALQSQVNPHFMFNTLNIITKIAYLEEAERTIAMIGAMSKILRYSLGSLNKVATLREEIENLDEYIFIQKTRFSDWLQFRKQINCDITGVRLPRLTFQPLVENAILHGIENKEEGGTVTLICNREKDDIVIEIVDNGVGIKPEIMEKIFTKHEKTLHQGHLTGLGLNNVKERLELFYGRTDVFTISSKEGQGTRVKIRVPSNFTGEGDLNV